MNKKIEWSIFTLLTTTGLGFITFAYWCSLVPIH